MEQRAPYEWRPQGREATDGKTAIRAVLRRHVGIGHAISSEQLAQATGLHSRKVRALISELIVDGMVIGASVDGVKGGYYIVETPEELEQTRAILRARAAEIFERDRALCRAWNANSGQELQPLLPGV